MHGRRCWMWMVVILGLASPAAAQELDAPRAEGPRGLQLALSVGAGGGVGYVYKNDVSSTTGEPEDLKITDASSITLPVLLEVGYRASPHCYLGLWGSYEKVFPKENERSCPDGFDCNFRQWRFGPEVRYHFSPGAGFDPWVGLGVGLEIAVSEGEGERDVPVPGVGPVPARIEKSVTDRGPTFARLALGGDVRLGRSLFLGPIVTASIGSYTVHTGERTVTLPGLPPQTTALTPVDDGFHALFTIALRVAWLPL
ncbi:hypothetical protein [Pyxidicoccus caerfyrddinensis]|uniref:hypothetical protein n=1 Tax=Pyxidicoccus caerfyrddinensis TaxID=2709663 RepID=UPI0013D8EE26|nr:hypothetical protein [Pyxidicoccus caerfyrddinensis]